MKKKTEQKVKNIFSNRLLGFDTPEDDAQLVVDTIRVLMGRGISVNRALSVLGDVSKIIPMIAEL